MTTSMIASNSTSFINVEEIIEMNRVVTEWLKHKVKVLQVSAELQVKPRISFKDKF